MIDRKKLVGEAQALVRKLSQAAWRAGNADNDDAIARVERLCNEQDRLLRETQAAIDALAAEPPQAVGPAVRWEWKDKHGTWHQFFNEGRALDALREQGFAVRALGVIEPKPQKSLSASVADALRPFIAEGQKVIWCEPFRWHDDNGVMSNCFEGMDAYAIAAEFGYDVIHDCGCAAVIATNPKD